MKCPCAIKLIRPNKVRHPRALARFKREVQAIARLSHWNTVEIFDYGRTDDNTFYYVMEYLPGLSLLQLVERYGGFAAGAGDLSAAAGLRRPGRGPCGRSGPSRYQAG